MLWALASYWWLYHRNGEEPYIRNGEEPYIRNGEELFKHNHQCHGVDWEIFGVSFIYPCTYCLYGGVTSVNQWYYFWSVIFLWVTCSASVKAMSWSTTSLSYSKETSGSVLDSSFRSCGRELPTTSGPQ